MTDLLKNGDLITLKPGHSVYAMIPKHFVYSNCKGDYSLCKSDVVIGGDYEHLAGQYIVYDTALTGGGTGHGPHDVYPDGHRVFCVQIGTGTKVDFYQTGHFTAMIRDLQPDTALAVHA